MGSAIGSLSWDRFWRSPCRSRLSPPTRGSGIRRANTACTRGAPVRGSPTHTACNASPSPGRKSGIEIIGNAWTWWDSASGVYQRGNAPEPGSVLAFPGRRGDAAWPCRRREPRGLPSGDRDRARQLAAGANQPQHIRGRCLAAKRLDCCAGGACPPERRFRRRLSDVQASSMTAPHRDDGRRRRRKSAAGSGARRTRAARGRGFACGAGRASDAEGNLTMVYDQAFPDTAQKSSRTPQ